MVAVYEDMKRVAGHSTGPGKQGNEWTGKRTGDGTERKIEREAKAKGATRKLWAS